MAGLSNQISKYVLLSGVALTASLALPAIAIAQDAPAPVTPAPAPDSNTGLGNADIVVTAQRRAQNLLSVPLSISAVKGETLKATGITDITGLRFNTPGFLSVSGTGYTQIYIRGIGNRISVGADPSVATFIDDVPRTYASLVDDLTNIERVEVLKGAQGGLYGRNATGGVVNIITRQPVDKFIAEARIGYGTKKTFDANVFINIPLNDNVAMNFTASRKAHDDYTPNKAVKNPYQSYQALSAAQATAFGDTGQRAFLIANPGLAARLDAGSKVSHMNNQDFWYFDGKIRFQGDGFKVTLMADYQHSPDANGNGWIERADTTNAYSIYAGLIGGTTGAFLFNNNVNIASAVLPRGYVYPTREGKFDTFGSITHHDLQSDYGAAARADIDMPGFVLSSITAVRWNHSQFRGDIGAANVPIAGFSTNFVRRSFYQEVRMVSDADGPFRWLAGATYYHDKIDNSLLSVVAGVEFAPTLATTVTNSFSGYVQGEYNITEKLKLTASVRYITEKKVGNYPAQTLSVFNYAPGTPVGTDIPGNCNGVVNGQGLCNGVSVGAATGTTGAHKFLPAITLSYALPNGGVVYARYAQGLKTGGVNPVVHPAQTLGEVNAFKPEAVKTYEIGVRTQLFDRKVQFTSAVFYNDYKNLAVTKPGYSGLPFVLFNAGKARTWGVEGSVTYTPVKYFTINANLGYLNAKYIDFHCDSPGLPRDPSGNFCIPELQVPKFNADGKTLIQAPKWQGGVTAQLDYPVTDSWNLSATVLYSYMSKFFNDDENTPDTKPGNGCALPNHCGAVQKAYSLVNLRVGAHSADNKIGVYVSVRNVFNKFYQAFGTSSNTAIYEIPGAPRIIMGQVELKF